MNTFNMNFATDMMKTWTDGFAKATQTATRFFDETTRTMTETGNQRSSEFQGQFDKMAEEFTPLTRKNSDRTQRFMDEQTQRGTKFFHESFDGRTPQTPAEMGERMSAFSRQTGEFVRDSLDAMAKFNTDVLNNWSEYVKARTAQFTTEPQIKKAGK